MSIAARSAWSTASAVACRGIVAALDVDAGFHDDLGELELPYGWAGQERVGLVGDLLGMTGEEADDEARHGKVVRVAQQRRYQNGKRCSCRSDWSAMCSTASSALTHVGADGRSAIPRPHVRVADEVRSPTSGMLSWTRGTAAAARGPATAPTRQLAA